ncbi:MAG: MoaD family protein [Candidatus Micrarchaeia archaeon]
MARAKGIRVRFSSALKPQTGEAETTLPSANSVKEALALLSQKYGEAFRRRIFDEAGSVRRFISIYVNGEDIRFKNGVETKLKAGDEVLILPAVSGG